MKENSLIAQFLAKFPNERKSKQFIFYTRFKNRTITCPYCEEKFSLYKMLGNLKHNHYNSCPSCRRYFNARTNTFMSATYENCFSCQDWLLIITLLENIPIGTDINDIRQIISNHYQNNKKRIVSLLTLLDIVIKIDQLEVNKDPFFTDLRQKLRLQ